MIDLKKFPRPLILSIGCLPIINIVVYLLMGYRFGRDSNNMKFFLIRYSLITIGFYLATPVIMFVVFLIIALIDPQHGEAAALFDYVISIPIAYLIYSVATIRYTLRKWNEIEPINEQK